ncbi:MAG: acyltransferase [Spirosomataceae bacterium]
MDKQKQNRITALDGLRGVAAVAVVLFHLVSMANHNHFAYGLILGVTGVDLFFIISGFVIFMTLQHAKTWKDFVISRFARLYPAYWAAILITLLFIWVFDEKNQLLSWPTFLANLTMIQYFLGYPNIEGTYWTLVVELLFYALMLLVWLINLRWIIGVGIGYFIIIGGILWLNQQDPTLYPRLHAQFPLLGHFNLFFAGILFYQLKFSSPHGYLHGLLMICLALVYPLHFGGGAAMGFITANWHFACVVVYFGLFYLLLYNRLGFMEHRFFVLLGGISYSLYLVHQTVGLLLIRSLKQAGVGRLPATLLGMMVGFALAIVMTYTVEKPAQRLIRGWFSGKK